MNVSELIWKPLAGQELEWVYHTYMERDFPSDELKPLSILTHLVDVGINTIWGCYREQKLAGYCVLAHLEGSKMYLLDYLAVSQELRGTGIGSQILASLKHSLKEGEYLLIESENPAYAENAAEQATRERRLRFYDHCGAVQSGVYILLFGVQFVGLTVSNHVTPSAQQQKEDYLSLYQEMLPREWYVKNVQVRLNL